MPEMSEDRPPTNRLHEYSPWALSTQQPTSFVSNIGLYAYYFQAFLIHVFLHFTDILYSNIKSVSGSSQLPFTILSYLCCTYPDSLLNILSKFRITEFTKQLREKYLQGNITVPLNKLLDAELLASRLLKHQPLALICINQHSYNIQQHECYPFLGPLSTPTCAAPHF